MHCYSGKIINHFKFYITTLCMINCMEIMGYSSSCLQYVEVKCATSKIICKFSPRLVNSVVSSKRKLLSDAVVAQSLPLDGANQPLLTNKNTSQLHVAEKACVEGRGCLSISLMTYKGAFSFLKHTPLFFVFYVCVRICHIYMLFSKT